MSNTLKDLDSTINLKEKLKKEPKIEDLSIKTSFIKDEDCIYEQCQKFQYINSKGEWHTELWMDGLKHIPIHGEELERGIVLLPEYPLEYGTILDLVESVKQHIHKYYDCEEQTEKFSAWYVLLSWVFDKLNTINYLRAMGDFGTGKSRFGDVVGRICYKPIIGSGAGSVAALKRMVNKWRGTIISDEGDFKDDDEKSELVKFYNLGFEKNRSIYQCNKNDPNKIEFYIPFCPKIILTRKDFTDKALESRCLTHITTTTRRKEIPIHLPNCFYEEEKVLRNKLLKFRFDYYYKIDSDKVMELNLGDIEPRLKQAMGSYAVLFANIPEMFNSFILYLKRYQNELIDNRGSSFDGQIINVICDLIIEHDNKPITVKQITDRINETQTGKFQTNVRTIGKHLTGLGLKTIQKKIEGKNNRVLEIGDNFIHIVKKYVSDLEKVTSVTCVTSVTLSLAQCKNSLLSYEKEKEHDDDTNDTNVTNVTRFNQKALIHNPCCHPKGYDGICGKTPCNDLEGINYCQEHFELMASKLAMEEKIIN